MTSQANRKIVDSSNTSTWTKVAACGVALGIATAAVAEMYSNKGC